jgi:hypothetical protein
MHCAVYRKRYSAFYITTSNPLSLTGQYMYHQFTAQWSLYVPPVYSPVVTICTTSLQSSGHYMYRQFTAQWSLYVPTCL